MKNHVTFSGELREPPAHILAALRSIDEGADLHYVGEGVWRLGVVRENWQLDDNGKTRRDSARKMLAIETRRLKPVHSNVQLAEMMLANFFEVATYFVQGSPTMAIVEDFRERDWRWKHAAEATFEQHLDEAEGIPQWNDLLASKRDYMETDGRWAYRRAIKGRRVFGPGSRR